MRILFDVLHCSCQLLFESKSRKPLIQFVIKLFYSNGFDITAVKLFESYLLSKEQCVWYKNQLSDFSSSKYGVGSLLQSSILGPLLSNIYINDLPDNILEDGVYCSLYADDVYFIISKELPFCEQTLLLKTELLQNCCNAISLFCNYC